MLLDISIIWQHCSIEQRSWYYYNPSVSSSFQLLRTFPAIISDIVFLPFHVFTCSNTLVDHDTASTTVESRYIELGYFEVSLISNRCQRPGDWQWL